MFVSGKGCGPGFLGRRTGVIFTHLPYVVSLLEANQWMYHVFQELAQLAYLCSSQGADAWWTMSAGPPRRVPSWTRPGLALRLALPGLAPCCSQRKDRADRLGEMLQGSLDVRSVAEPSSHSSSWGAGGLAMITGRFRCSVLGCAER